MNKFVKFICILSVICLMVTAFAVPTFAEEAAEEAAEGAAEGEAKEKVEPNAIWYFDEDLPEIWEGENATLDNLAFDPAEWATMLMCYNTAWASRYGGGAFIGRGLDIPISKTKNRYCVISLRPDDVAIDNAFDALRVIYWTADAPGAPKYTTNDYKNAGRADSEFRESFVGLHTNDNSEFTKYYLDCCWNNEEELTLKDFRMEILSSSLDKAAFNRDGANCGYLYIEYIAFFDTLEDAQAFKYPDEPDPTEKPAETEAPTAEATEEPTEEATAAPTDEPADSKPTENAEKPTADNKDNGGKKDGKKNNVVLPIILCALVLVVVAIVIVLLTKKKK